MTPRALRATLIGTALLTLAACGSGGSSDGSSDGSSGSDTTGGTPLVGTFRIAAGKCSGSTATGSYFRMVQPGGTLEKGKFFGNPDSPCADKSFTPQAAGSDGGLVTGRFQSGGDKAFDANGNALASSIVKPSTFTAIAFGVSTAQSDPQTDKKVPAPEIRVEDGKLSGQITAWSAAWNNLYFNQGSPKPDGSRPGLTSPVSGTYDEKTKAYTLSWASQIVGGPFNGFTGYWHLEGTFAPAK